MTERKWEDETWCRLNASGLLQATNLKVIRTHAVQGAAAAVRVNSYSVYLAAIRHRKATTAFPAHFENDVAKQARGAAADVRELMWRSLSVVRQFRNCGLLDEMFAALERTVRASNAIDLGAAADLHLQGPAVIQALSPFGIGETEIAATRQYLARIPIVLHAGDPGRLRLDDLEIATAPANAQPTTLAEALRGNRFDSVVDELGSQSPWTWAPAGVQTQSGGPVYFYGRMAAQACLATLDFVRHARKIEDVGLTTYEGNDPGTWLFIAIVGGLLITAGTIILVACATHEETSKGICNAGWTLVTLGLYLVFRGALGSSGDPGTHGNTALQIDRDDAQVPPPDAVPR